MVYGMDEEEAEAKTPFGPHFADPGVEPGSEDISEDSMVLADAARDVYDAFIAKHFTEEQALYLTGEILKRPE